MGLDQAKCLEKLGQENNHLKEVVVVFYVLERFQVSERWVCSGRSTPRYRPEIRDDDKPLVILVLELASDYGRYGYRRITLLLKREGLRINHKRGERLWRREGLEISKRQHFWLTGDKRGFLSSFKSPIKRSCMEV